VPLSTLCGGLEASCIDKRISQGRGCHSRGGWEENAAGEGVVNTAEKIATEE